MICPSCNTFLINKAISCSCGWQKSEQKSAPKALRCAFEGCTEPALIRKRVSQFSWTTVCEKHDVELETKAAKEWLKSVGLDRQTGEPMKAWMARTLVWLEADRNKPRKLVIDGACQERTCPITMRALPGKAFCRKHQDQFERDPTSVRVISRPAGMGRVSDYIPPLAPPRQREPGDDDEEIHA